MQTRPPGVGRGEGAKAQFVFDDKPYFWVSDRRAAEPELKALP